MIFLFFLILIILMIFFQFIIFPAAPRSFWPHTPAPVPSLTSTLSVSTDVQLFESAKLGSRVVREGACSDPRPFIEGAHLLYQLDNWDDQAYVSGVRQKLSSLLHKVFFTFLLADPRQRRLVVCENLFHPRQLKQLLLSLCFEDLKVASVTLVSSHLLALLSVRRASGLVIDCGFWETSMVPFYDARPLMSSARSLPLASAAINHRLRALLKEHATLTDTATGTTQPLSALQDTSFLDLDLLENLKARIASVAEVPREQKARDASSVVQVPLSNSSGSVSSGGGRVLTFPAWIGEEICEVLFEKDPEDDRSLPISIAETLLWSNTDVRATLASSILVTGGTAMIPGFQRRLEVTLRSLIAAEERYVPLRPLLRSSLAFVLTPFKPNLISWAGASAIGPLKIHSHEISAEDFLTRGRQAPDWSIMQLRTALPTSE